MHSNDVTNPHRTLTLPILQKDEAMEMQQGAGGQDASQNQYGVEAGYTEDYGASAKMEPLPVDDQGYGTMGSNVENENGGAARNPFTQQQYENQKSSNPFK